ncbi:hypothetical protein ACJA3J_05720 [Halobacillus sp. SY10]|uniref:hypothetical protein n=1 Tax=Halobacillus sp. SY10 TaxID=3381356 RepID=UPI0038792939
MELVSWDMIWEVAGPFLIMGAVALVVGLVCIIILKSMENGIFKELFRVLSFILVITLPWISLQVSTEIWAM